MNEINKTKRLYLITFNTPVRTVAMLSPEDLKNSKAVIEALSLTQFPMEAAEQVLTVTNRITAARIHFTTELPTGWTGNDVPFLLEEEEHTVAKCIDEGALEDQRVKLRNEIKALQAKLDQLD